MTAVWNTVSSFMRSSSSESNSSEKRLGICDELKKFVGRWEEQKSRGGDIEPVLLKMNVSWIKRKGYQVASLINELIIDDEGKNITVVNSLWGLEKRYTLPLDGSNVDLKDNDVGVWHITTKFDKGELVSVRTSKDQRFEMTTIRRILPDDPAGVVFQHRTVLKIEGDPDTPLTCNRYFRKIK
eukprot:Platyproteum_vivax@DN3279_c0_g1_i1.p1